MNTADILDRAADLIEERGWHQGWYVNDCGQLCIRGAMLVAVGIEPPQKDMPWPDHSGEANASWQEATDEMDEYLDDLAERWNDAPERTKEEVVSTLRAAAQAARAEQ